jgi:hypothetical protein
MIEQHFPTRLERYSWPEVRDCWRIFRANIAEPCDFMARRFRGGSQR